MTRLLLIVWSPSFLRHQLNFLRWAWTLFRGAQKSGQKLCPLMVQEPLRFNGPVVFCDVPHTRAAYLRKVGRSVRCAHDGVCRPHRVLQKLAQDEMYPIKVTRYRKPRHGAPLHVAIPG